MKYSELLLNNNYVSIQAANNKVKNNDEALATIALNIAYYGKGLSQEAFNKLKLLDTDALVSWWEEIECNLKKITGADKNMDKHIVYKNFPKEVLDKSEMEYWLPQILMYWGFPKELFCEEEKARPKLADKKQPVILHLANDNNYETLNQIMKSIAKTPALWKKTEELAIKEFYTFVNISDIAFKENMVSYAKYLLSKNIDIEMKSATDILRLAAAMSGADPSLKVKFKFKSFPNKLRKMFLKSLDKMSNLEDDISSRKETWKRFLFGLHAKSDNKYKNVSRIVDLLYQDNLNSFNSQVEKMLTNKDVKVLDLLSQRPGVFKRRLVHTIKLFGVQAAKRFVKKDVLSKLTIYQLVSLKAFLNQKNNNIFRTFPPKGNWSKLKIVTNTKMNKTNIKLVVDAIRAELSVRVPKVKILDSKLASVKLPSSGDTVKYPKGTEIFIPEDVKFLRISSYWQTVNNFTVWFDNGVNFFDSNWNGVSSICWNIPKVMDSKKTVAAFSGDPVNSFTADKKACQVIDIYMENLPEGIRYGVWNILCYSRVKFSQAKEVVGCLQWGNDPLTGKVFEPSRAQVTFPITGDYYSKFICVFDFLERKVIFLDANFKANVSSAQNNTLALQSIMPAYMEHLNSIPSVYDVFQDSVNKKSKDLALYSDKDVSINGENAYVFKPENEKNKFNQININAIIS